MNRTKQIASLVLVFFAGVFMGARTTLNNGILVSDLDANNHKITNLSVDQQYPGTANVADNSILNIKIASNAAILQSKLNLNGVIPTAWLGSTSTTAAQGNLVELLANKAANNGYAGLDGAGKVTTGELPTNIPTGWLGVTSTTAAQGNLVELLSRKAQVNGYASLDSGGKIPVGQLPDSAGVGTVTSVGMTVPSILTLSGSPVTTSGTLAVSLTNAAAVSWFGNPTAPAAVPIFNTTALPIALIPSLDTAKITTGTLAAARLPVMIGVGGSHAIGAVPDPGASGTATDYLARDATYKAIPGVSSYQPVIPQVAMPASTNTTGARTITITSLSVPGSAIFYNKSDDALGFRPYTGSITVQPEQYVDSYAAKAGYTNSTMRRYTNPNTAP